MPGPHGTGTGPPRPAPGACLLTGARPADDDPGAAPLRPPPSTPAGGTAPRRAQGSTSMAGPGHGVRPAISAPSNCTTAAEPGWPRAVGWKWPRRRVGARNFGPSGTIGRGRCMYEMQRPRPVLRSRPADFSASFAPLDHLPGPATLPVVRLPRSPAGFGTPPGRVARELPFAKDSEFPQSPAVPSISRAMAQSFLSPHDPGFPPRPSDSSFPFAEGGSELSFRRMARGFPSAS